MTKALATGHLRECCAPDGVLKVVLDFEEPELPPSTGTVVRIVLGNDLLEGCGFA
jgi:hypothetical protein